MKKYLLRHKTLIYILTFGFILRLVNLNQSLWLDEAINILAVKSNNLIDLITKYSLNDFHPPLYHVILFFWTKIFGYSEIASRLPSVFFSLTSILIVYKIGSDFFSKKTALVAAFLLAVSPLGIYYSQEARMYSLTMFLASISFYYFLCLLYKKFNFFRLLTFTFFLTLGFYSDYIFWIFGSSLYYYLYKRSKVEKVLTVLSLALIFLFLSPWLRIFLNQLSIGISQAKSVPLWGAVVGGASIKNLLLIPVKFSIGRISFFDKKIYILYLIPVISITIIAFYNTFKKYKKEIPPFLLWLLAPVLISFLISFFIPVLSYFRLLLVLPAFLFIIALGIKNSPILLSVLIIFSLISSGIYLFNPVFQRENWKEAVKFIEENSKGNSASLLVNIAQGAPYEYYSKNTPLIDEKNLDIAYDKIFFIRYSQPIFDPKETVLAKIVSLGYIKEKETDFNGVAVWEYKR